MFKQVIFFTISSLVLSYSCSLSTQVKNKIQGFLAPFSNGLTREQIILGANEKLICLVEIENGELREDCLLKEWRSQLKAISKYLPNVVLLVNLMDSPRVFKHWCHPDDDFRECACDKGYVHPDHGFFLTSYWTPIFKKLPIFGPTTISECFMDIILPSIFHLQDEQGREGNKETDWEKAVSKAYWRGTTTGGDWKVPGPHFSLYHRQRLVALCQKLDNCDAKFSAYTQCNPPLCKEMRKTYGEPHYLKYRFQPQHKVLIDIDGNTYSARFGRLLESGSLVIKIAIFEDYVTIQTKPWLHYVPVNMNLSDFQQKVEWALEKEDESRKIAKNGRQKALQITRDEILDCYVIQLLSQYSKLFKKRQEIIENQPSKINQKGLIQDVEIRNLFSLQAEQIKSQEAINKLDQILK